jgi:NAD(P)-dependent dehydrogenase (short-subunit alcohol dehydrogenase family)
MTKDLDGKTALVTGGASGIGRGIAERLARAGAMVALVYATKTETAQAVVKAIEAAGGQAFAIKAQLGTPEAAQSMATMLDAELTNRTGGATLDILVNNIGGSRFGTVETATAEDFDWVMNNNVRAPFFVTQALIPRLNDGGRIINISSAGTRIAAPEFIAYCMAKAALEMFTVVVAKHLGPRQITVNSVAPGYVDTPAVAHRLADPQAAKAIADATIFRRIGKPDDIADFVHALASPAGRWITAQKIEVSGGLRF